MDAYIHLGDIGFDLHYLDKFWIVRGNHDNTSALPMERFLHLENRQILCAHGNLFDKETVDEVLAMHSIDSEDIMDICMNTLYGQLTAYAKRKGCDTFFFGHTHHQVDVEVEGCLLYTSRCV